MGQGERDSKWRRGRQFKRKPHSGIAKVPSVINESRAVLIDGRKYYVSLTAFAESAAGAPARAPQSATIAEGFIKV
jgi:hypothetical protein